MAYSVTNGNSDVVILIDGREDLKDLPTTYDVGSVAYTADHSVSATLSPSKVWVEHKTGETGGNTGDSGGSGGSIMVINVTRDDNYGDYHSDKNFDELMDALGNGTMMFCRYVSSVYVLASEPDFENEDPYFLFTSANGARSSYMSLEGIKIAMSGEVDAWSTQHAVLLPN